MHDFVKMLHLLRLQLPRRAGIAFRSLHDLLPRHPLKSKTPSDVTSACYATDEPNLTNLGADLCRVFSEGKGLGEEATCPALARGGYSLP